MIDTQSKCSTTIHKYDNIKVNHANILLPCLSFKFELSDFIVGFEQLPGRWIVIVEQIVRCTIIDLDRIIRALKLNTEVLHEN